jgi:hypothetical protein
MPTTEGSEIRLVRRRIVDVVNALLRRFYKSYEVMPENAPQIVRHAEEHERDSSVKTGPEEQRH